MTKETNIDQSVSNVVEMDISDELQQIITDNMFWLKRRSRVRQADLAKSLGISQPTLSQKYSRTVAWTINDLAKAAVFFKVPVSYLVTDNFIEPSSEYQLEHNVPVDISRRELSAPAGARYLRKPDDDESRSHGAVGPRTFVMPLDVDQMNLGPRFSARTRFKLPHVDSTRSIVVIVLDKYQLAPPDYTLSVATKASGTTTKAGDTQNVADTVTTSRNGSSISENVTGTSTLRWTGVDGTTHNTWNGDTEVTAEGYYYASEDETILQPVARKDGETVDQITSTLR